MDENPYRAPEPVQARYRPPVWWRRILASLLLFGAIVPVFVGAALIVLIATLAIESYGSEHFRVWKIALVMAVGVASIICGGAMFLWADRLRRGERLLE